MLEPKEISPMEILTQKYLIRNGKRIGIYHSKSLAWEMGLLTEKPDELYIMTNIEASLHGRHRIINGYSVHIRANEIIITKDNYKYLMVLEAIRYCWHFDGSKKYLIVKFIRENQLSYNGFVPLLPHYSKKMRMSFIGIWRSYEQNN